MSQCRPGEALVHLAHVNPGISWPIRTCRRKSSATAVAAQMLKLRTAGMGVRAPRPKASTSQAAAMVMEGPVEPKAKPTRVTRGREGS